MILLLAFSVRLLCSSNINVFLSVRCSSPPFLCTYFVYSLFLLAVKHWTQTSVFVDSSVQFNACFCAITIARGPFEQKRIRSQLLFAPFPLFLACLPLNFLNLHFLIPIRGRAAKWNVSKMCPSTPLAEFDL